MSKSSHDPQSKAKSLHRLNFDNTEIAFAARSTLELLKAQLLFKTFAYPLLVQNGPKLVSLALKLRLPVTPVIKKTLFDHFCGGTSIEDCQAVIEQLGQWKVGSILDYSVEGAESEADFEHTTAEIERVIDRACGDAAVPFAVFKVTGIARFALLEKLSADASLSEDEIAEESRVRARFERLCQRAHDCGVRIMIDAEESWIQAAIDRYALDMMQRFNLQQPIVFNTVQMYRVDRYAYLEELLKLAASQGFFVGIKLVRGAYMEKERQWAQERSLSSPIHPDKLATDRAFDAALRLLLAHIERAAVVAGSHNEASLRLLTELMHQYGLEPTDMRCEFAQLLGMSDHLTYNLAHAGFRASKYVPYGPVRAVLPYLFRRAEENSSIQGQAGRELQLIEREITRRARRLRASKRARA